MWKESCGGASEARKGTRLELACPMEYALVVADSKEPTSDLAPTDELLLDLSPKI